MTITTVPTIIIALVFFTVYNLLNEPNQIAENMGYVESMKEYFFISPILFLVPLIVILFIIKKINPIISLFVGVITASIFFLIFQNELIVKLVNELGINRYQIIMNSIVSETNIQTDIIFLSELFNSDGMKGMLNTIWLVISAMIFGGVMESIGALKKSQSIY